MIIQAANYPVDRCNMKFFSIKYLKWVLDSGAAQEVGPEAVTLLMTVALMEDAFGYRRAVSFFNDQLTFRCGFRNVKTMDVARTKAVVAGLLHYQPSAKRQPGVYWVLPDCLPDSSPMPSKSFHETGMETGRMQEGSGAPPPLTLLPIPKPHPDGDVSEAATPVPELSDWCVWWNRLHAEGLVTAGVSATPSMTLQAAWKKSRKSPELRELLSNRQAIEKAIRESEFVRNGWFRLEKLMAGKNKAGEFIAKVLVEGGYLNALKSRVANTGPGVTFDPKRDYSNAKF